LVYGYRPSTSEFGEIDEEWGLVEENVPCYLDLGDRPMRLTKGGLLESWGVKLFLNTGASIALYDRISVGSRYYSVESINDLKGYKTYNHVEVSLNLIDWDASSVTGFWEPGTMDIPFAFDSTSPLLLARVSSTARILRVGIEIEEAFDDAATTLSIGTSSNATLFQNTSQNIPTVLGYYETAPLYEMSSADEVRLYITPGASTQGRGYIYVEVQENV
jgi:hypothetical protein